MAILVKEASSSTEINQYFSSYYSVASEEGVICRTASTLISNLPTDKPSKFQRNRKYRGTGYFSSTSQPYKPFGEILEMESLSPRNCLRSLCYDEIHPPFSAGTQNKMNSDNMRLLRNTSQQNGPIKVQKISNDTSKPPPSINAGFSSINIGLCTTDWGRREVRAGACVADTMNRQKERKSFLHDCQQVKFYKQKTEFKKTHTPSVYLNGVSIQNSYKGSLVSRNLEIPITQDAHFSEPIMDISEAKPSTEKNEITSNLMVSIAAAHFKHNATRHNMGVKLKAELLENQTKCIETLEKIYCVLCIICNMRLGDLRSKKPLTSKYIRSLSHKPRHYSGPGVVGNVLGHVTGHAATHSDGVASGTQRQRSLGQRANGSSSFTAKVASPFDPLGNHTSGRCTGASGRGTGGSGKGTNRIREAPPPWQRPIVYIDLAEEEKNRSPEERMSACFELFQQSRDIISYKLAQKMEENDRNYNSRLASKLEFLKFGKNAINELLAMREKTFAEKEFKKKRTKPEWFEVLELEANSSLKQPHFIKQGSYWINKLTAFVLLDIKSIPNILERLCLYTFSLPAYLVCRPTEMSAIKFVLQHVLLVKPVLFNQWMNIRKLPIELQ